jgi:hypothetical protein
MLKRRWVPEAVLPAVEFLNRTDFKLQDWGFYKVRPLLARQLLLSQHPSRAASS